MGRLLCRAPGEGGGQAAGGQPEEGSEEGGKMTMDQKLKEALIKKIELAQKDLAHDPILKVKLESKGRSTSLGVDVERPKNALLVLVRKKLLKERMWEPVQAELARIALADFVKDFQLKQAASTSKIEISAARERQLSLFPGFESLPTRIRKGNNYLKFPDAPVPDFLAYAAKYEQRSQRDQKTADELRRLAKAVEPYAEMELTLAAAFDRAKQNSADRVVFMLSVG